MNLAEISVLALVLAVVVSCVSRLNVGVLAIALAWIVGVYIGGIPVNTVMAGFPSQLCLTLIGVTLLFALAETNGTLGRIVHRAVRICRGNCGTIPIMFFVLGFVPAWILSKILDGFGLLRVPRQVELMGLDFRTLAEEEAARADVRAAEKALA